MTWRHRPEERNEDSPEFAKHPPLEERDPLRLNPFAEQSEGRWRVYSEYERGRTDSKEPFGDTWPKSGVSRGGTVSELPPITPPPFEDATLEPPVGNWISMWPTPAASEPGWRLTDGSKIDPVDKHGEFPDDLNQRWYDEDTGRIVQKGLRQAVEFASLKMNGAVSGSKVNPSWVEWLMGWPTGWTACEPSMSEKDGWEAKGRSLVAQKTRRYLGSQPSYLR